MRILLVNPKIPAAAMNFAHAMDLIDCDFAHIPLPLVTVAALTPSSHEVALVDENVDPIDFSTPCDLVALTGIYSQASRLFAIADRFRSLGKLVVVGGALASDRPDDCLEHADAIVVGEAEYVWPRLIADAERGALERRYEQFEPVDMSDSPVPRFGLLRADRYSAGCIQATRGCPYQCEYCDVPTKHGRKPRSKSVAQVLEEVRLLSGLGFDSIFFVDDHFAGNRRYARELLAALAGQREELRRPIYFYTQVTLNVARDEELLRDFAAAGFRRFFLGIESASVGALKGVQKHHNVEMSMEAAIDRIQRHGITVWAGLMVGLDGEGPDVFELQRSFVQRTAITPTLVGIMQAMPGAPLYDRVRAAGRLRVLDDVVASSAYGSAEAMSVSNVEPVDVDEPGFLRGYASLVRALYEPDAYAERLLTATAKSAHEAPDWRALGDPRNLRAVARACAYYARHPEPAARRMFARVIATLVARRFASAEEILYHLVVFKHLSTFYREVAEGAERRAARLESEKPRLDASP